MYLVGVSKWQWPKHTKAQRELGMSLSPYKYGFELERFDTAGGVVSHTKRSGVGQSANQKKKTQEKNMG